MGHLQMDGASLNNASSISQRQVRLPRHIVDLAADDLRTADGGHVELRPRSFAVLRLLAENAGRLVGKDDIITKVWDDVAVTEDSLTQCIADIARSRGRQPPFLVGMGVSASAHRGTVMVDLDEFVIAFSAGSNLRLIQALDTHSPC